MELLNHGFMASIHIDRGKLQADNEEVRSLIATTSIHLYYLPLIVVVIVDFVVVVVDDFVVVVVDRVNVNVST